MRFFLLLIVLGWLVGIAGGQWQVGNVWLSGAVLVLAGLLIKMRQQRLLPAVISVLLIGYLYGLPEVSPASECTQLVSADVVKAQVVAPPRHGGQSSRYELRTESGCVLLVTAPRFPVYGQGDVLEIADRPQPVSELLQENPGYAGYLQRRGIYGTWYFPTVTRLEVGNRPARIYTALDATITQLFREPDASMVRALILADDGELPAELKDNFRATGLTHILAISGMNISLWATMLILVLQPLPLSPLARTVLISSLLWVYMALINWPISAVRATFFWTIALLALRVQALVSLPSVLFFTLLVMLSLQPLLAQDVGFQLSVSAVAGIFLILFVARKVFMRLKGWPTVVFGICAVTMGATLTTWPIIAYHFGTISFTALLANILVGPVVELQMAAVVTTLVLGSFSHPLALLPSLLTHLTVQWMQAVAAVLAEFPGWYWTEVQFPVWAVAVYYVGVAALSHMAIKWQRRSWREVWE